MQIIRYLVFALSLYMVGSRAMPMAANPTPIVSGNVVLATYKLHVAKDSTKKTTTVELALPIVFIHRDSVAFYMELLRRLGNREDVSDMGVSDAISNRSTAAGITVAAAVSLTTDTVSSEPIYAASAGLSATEQVAYLQMIDEISIRRLNFAELYQQTDNNTTKKQVLEEAANYLTETVIGTFMARIEGKVLLPQKAATDDDIAHNKQLVVTLLHDFGFTTDFDGMPKNSARTIAKSLATDHILKYCKDMDELDKYLSKKGRGLYIMSYDKYVGFVWNSGTEISLLIADPLNGGKVSQSPLQKAPAFQQYVPYFNIGSLSDNLELIEDWLKENKVLIQK